MSKKLILPFAGDSSGGESVDVRGEAFRVSPLADSSVLVASAVDPVAEKIIECAMSIRRGIRLSPAIVEWLRRMLLDWQATEQQTARDIVARQAQVEGALTRRTNAGTTHASDGEATQAPSVNGVRLKSIRYADSGQLSLVPDQPVAFQGATASLLDHCAWLALIWDYVVCKHKRDAFETMPPIVPEATDGFDGDQGTDQWGTYRVYLHNFGDCVRGVSVQFIDDRTQRALDAVQEELVARGLLDQEKEAAEAVNDATCQQIAFHGNGCYSIGQRVPVAVDSSEDYVLQAFIESPALSLADLKKKSGVDRPNEVLKRLASKYDRQFADAIRLPGGKSKGGYRVSIRKAESSPSATST